MPFLCSQDVFLTETKHLGTCLVLVIASQRIRCCWEVEGKKGCLEESSFQAATQENKVTIMRDAF